MKRRVITLHSILLMGLFLYVIGIALPVLAQPREQYKKNNRDAIGLIVDGKYDAAIRSLQQELQDYQIHFTSHHRRYPVDLEALFGLALAYANTGDTTTAMACVRRALDAGLPVERFQAGPRDLLQPLQRTEAFRQLMQPLAVELLHGPLLGSVTDHSARFWVRTMHAVPVEVVLSRSPSLRPILRKAQAATDPDEDYTAVLAVGDLQPDTRYYYRVRVNGENQPRVWQFHTFPERGTPAAFQIGFGGGAGFTPWHEYMWNTLDDHGLRAMLLLGDNVYIDHPTYPDVQRYCYYRRQSRPEFRSFAASTPLYAIWDDHDFTENDQWGGPAIDTPPWKRPVWQVYKQNWNNPSYGGGAEQPGCWFRFSIADVDFFMLDGRYYRTDPADPHPSMLGPVQKQWLFQALQASRGTFKVLVSPVPWAFGTKPGSRDTWEGYKQERAEIFSFLTENKINGVILLSADRHRSDLWRIDREGAYPLYEFESSKLTNVHTHKEIPGALFGYNQKCSFGKLLFDTDRPDPTVSYEIYSIDNELVDKITLSRSELTAD